jgi:putative transposase
MLTDGADIPLSVAIEGANCHDAKLLVVTMEGLVVARPGWEEVDEQHMCLDAAYDSEPVREELKERGYLPHISPADKKEREREGPVHRHGGRARRWVVEQRTHSWLNRSRRLLARSEKKAESYLAFIQLACAQLNFIKITVSG